MKNFLLIFLLMSGAWLYGQKSGSQSMHWRLVPAGESPAAVSEYSSVDKGRILCFLSNNDDYMFVDMVIADPAVQKKVLDVGMNIWIDVTGKERKVISARYPVGANTIKDQLNRKGERMTAGEMRMLAMNSTTSMAYEVMYSGFTEAGTMTVPARAESGCSAALHYNDDGDLIYFLAIPLKDIKFQESKGKSVPFSLGIEYGVQPVIVRPQAPAGGGAAAGGRGGAAGGGAVGGTRGGAAGGGAPPELPSQVQLPGTSVCWIKGLIPAAGK